jgi:hypothetical protein
MNNAGFCTFANQLKKAFFMWIDPRAQQLRTEALHPPVEMKQMGLAAAIATTAETEDRARLHASGLMQLHEEEQVQEQEQMQDQMQEQMQEQVVPSLSHKPSFHEHWPSPPHSCSKTGRSCDSDKTLLPGIQNIMAPLWVISVAITVMAAMSVIVCACACACTYTYARTSASMRSCTATEAAAATVTVDEDARLIFQQQQPADDGDYGAQATHVYSATFAIAGEFLYKLVRRWAKAIGHV